MTLLSLPRNVLFPPNLFFYNSSPFVSCFPLSPFLFLSSRLLSLFPLPILCYFLPQSPRSSHSIPSPSSSPMSHVPHIASNFYLAHSYHFFSPSISFFMFFFFLFHFAQFRICDFLCFAFGIWIVNFFHIHAIPTRFQPKTTTSFFLSFFIFCFIWESFSLEKLTTARSFLLSSLPNVTSALTS